MLKENCSSTTTTNNGGGHFINNLSQVCDTCRSAACKIYCHADSAYLCSDCDASIHAANRVASRHERVWVCEACERAPAAFFCKADNASLCSSCDAEIHSANLLAGRHQRVPLFPFSGCLQHHHDDGVVGCEVEEEEEKEIVDEEEDEAEAASWLLSNPVKNSEENGFLFGDEYLNLVDCNSCGGDDNNQFSNVCYDNNHEYQHQNQNQHTYNTVPQNYAVVPVQQQFQHGFDFDSSKAGFSYDGSSISQSVSVSSMDVGVVPETTMSDISISHSKSLIGTSDHIFPAIPMPSQFTTMDREAKVLRYKEKKKTRKFEKKIRYVSRKAYAENRPRIKGRFAKRTDVDADQIDHMHSTTRMIETECNIVPSFSISR